MLADVISDFLREHDARRKRNPKSIAPGMIFEGKYLGGIAKFRNQVEAITGFDFLSNVPVSIQNVIEARVDNQ